MKLPRLEERIERARDLIHRMYESLDLTLDAVEADGWSRAMARRGFELHRHTWNIDGLVEALDAELGAFGGLRALERPVRGRRIYGPDSVIHIWPALPGAGVTPTLFGWLLGARQIVRPSRRSRHFSQLFGELWLSTMGDASVSMEEGPKESWGQADIIVVSGTDDTIAAVREAIGDHGHRRSPHVIGFGHRVSVAVVVDDETPKVMEVARDIAQDIVLWHQTGCFSARAVLFCGAQARSEAFGARLGVAIQEAEASLEATTLSDAELSRRAQARGVAEFTTQLWGGGLGWVQGATEPFDGAQVSTHAVTLHPFSRLGELAGTLQLPERNLQGAALWCAPEARASWVEGLGRAGFTRVCAPGRLQAPPPSWAHDGWPNVLDWVRVCTVDDGAQ